MRRLRILLLLLPLTFIWIIGWGLYWTGSRRHQKRQSSARADSTMENLKITADVLLDEIRA